jgi:hypothetical protein
MADFDLKIHRESQSSSRVRECFSSVNFQVLSPHVRMSSPTILPEVLFTTLPSRTAALVSPPLNVSPWLFSSEAIAVLAFALFVVGVGYDQWT